MTENEKFTIDELIDFMYNVMDDSDEEAIPYVKEVIQALEEIQQYRAIGTVEDIKKKMEELDRWHTVTIKENIKNPFANTSTSICHNCDHKDEYIEELESEIEEYQAIGTIEEFKDLKQKNEPKKVAYQGEHEKCPTCRSFRVFGNYCTECGQKIDWGNE